MITNKNEDNNEKYKLVVDEWFNNGFVGVDAYQKYYPNTTKKAAKTGFSRLKKLPYIREYINHKQEEASKHIGRTHKDILDELMRWIEYDMTETIGLTPKEIKELPITLRRLIVKYKVDSSKRYDLSGNMVGEEERIECTFVSKEKAMEMITKHLGFYEVDNKQKANASNLASLTTEELLQRAKLIRVLSNE